MKKSILIQGAMEEETACLVKALTNPKTVYLGVWEYVTGTLYDYPVVVSRTRIGMSNAAASTVLAIEHFNPIAIINQGTAGGHSPALHTGDIVLATSVINIGAFETQYLKRDEGMCPATWSLRALESYNRTEQVWQEKIHYYADTLLLETARDVAKCYDTMQVVEGVIGSGDLWNKEIDRILWLNETLQTVAEEMEAASVAQIAANYDIPYLCIRIVSNNEMYEEVFDATTGIECQNFVLKVVENYINNELK